MKPVGEKSKIYIDSNKEINNKDFEIGEVVRISKYKNVFGKCYTPNCSEEVFGIKKLKILSCGHRLLMILMGKKLLEPFTNRNC